MQDSYARILLFSYRRPILPSPFLQGLSHFATYAHVLRLKNEGFARDPMVVKSMNEDPLIANELQPTSTVAQMARADERRRREFSAY